MRNKFVADPEKKPNSQFRFVDEQTSNVKYALLALFLVLNLINGYLLIRNSDIFKASG